MNLKNTKLGKFGLVLACTVGIATLSSTADAYWHNGNWHGNGYRHGVHVNVGPGYRGYYRHGYYYNRPYYRNVNYYNNCRWIPAGYYNGYWHNAGRYCY